MSQTVNKPDAPNLSMEPGVHAASGNNFARRSDFSETHRPADVEAA